MANDFRGDPRGFVGEAFQVLARNPLLEGTIVSGRFAVGTATAYVKHGLGRQYTGGIVVAVDDYTYPIAVMLPSSASGVLDARTYARLMIIAPAPVTMNFKVLVF